LVPFYISFIIAGEVFFMRAITLHEEYTWNWRYKYYLFIYLFLYILCPNNGPAEHYSLSCKDMLCRIESKLNHSERERERERRWTKNFPLHFMSCWDTDFLFVGRMGMVGKD
jgi:hypothetical protein